MALAHEALHYAKRRGANRTMRRAPMAPPLAARGHRNAPPRTRTRAGLSALLRAAGARDPAMTARGERVARLSYRLALADGWPVERARRLRDVALVHDVGMLATADAVRFKTGALSAAEYENVKAHAAIGTQILAELLDSEQLRWVRSHHERPDGSGYPDGLRDGQIPDGARLLAVADAFAAMTADRPHRAARPREQALDELLAGAGSQFDPRAIRLLDHISLNGAR
jgi:HD-GYP domain-containing protein (c-di-GMP phosphodiesterase class II)